MTNIAKAIEQLTEEAKRSSRAELRDAALATGAAPICVTLSGIYVVTQASGVLLFDPETHAVSEADDEWRTLVLVQAARKHPSLLAELIPKRPPQVPDCSVCAGKGVIERFSKTGVLRPGAICGPCQGKGWSDPAGDPDRG